MSTVSALRRMNAAPAGRVLVGGDGRVRDDETDIGHAVAVHVAHALMLNAPAPATEDPRTSHELLRSTSRRCEYKTTHTRTSTEGDIVHAVATSPRHAGLMLASVAGSAVRRRPRIEIVSAEGE